MGQRHQRLKKIEGEAAASMGLRHQRLKVEAEAAEWMLTRLQHDVAIASGRMCYGAADLREAASCGAVQVLLLGRHVAVFDDALHEEVWRHGGRVIQVRHDNQELDMLGTCALLLFAIDDAELDADDTVEKSPSAKRQKSWGESSLAMALPTTSTASFLEGPPTPQRTLTDVATPGAPVELIAEAPSSSLADEMALLHAMFDRKFLRQLAPFNGTHFLLLVEDTCDDDTPAWLILEFALPVSYPEAPPIVTAPFGQVGTRVLSDDEAAAAAASCSASVEGELGEPVLYSMYDAARAWLLERHARAT